MAKTIYFKPEFEKKLKELKIKTKFVNELRRYCKATNKHFINRAELINKNQRFYRFLFDGFPWHTTKDGYPYWSAMFNKSYELWDKP
jgi:hypothetical protein